MKKELRLRHSSDFKKTFKAGRRFFSPHFALYYKDNDLPNARIGVSISKSHFKLATRRNRIRRVAREVFKEMISAGLKGCDLVVTSRRAWPERDIKKATEEVKTLLARKQQ